MVPRDVGCIKCRTLLMCPGIWFRAASGRIYQSWCLTENWVCVKGVCSSCAVLRPAVTSAFTCCTSCSSCPPQCVTVSAFSKQSILSWSLPAQSPDTALLVVPCTQQRCWRRDGDVQKGGGSVCISLFCFPKVCVFELSIPLVPRNSFPLKGFYYPAHAWGGFLEALSWNSSWLHKKPVSQFAGCFGSTLMRRILSTLV